MKINSLPGAVGSTLQDISNRGVKKSDFKTIFQSIRGNADLGFDKSLTNLDQLREKIAKSGNLSAAQILQYQIYISELNLRVELVSKAAESAATLGRKLQSAQ